jgi:alkylhydroperoxidase family enzyme
LNYVKDRRLDTKLDALVKFTASVVENKGKATPESKTAFFNAGYTEVNMIDVVIVVGDKIVSNYIHNLADFAIDFLLLQHYNFNPLIKTNTILSHRAQSRCTL